jgi:hypothetical protein
MQIDLHQLRNLLSKRTEEIAQSVSGTGYLPKTVIGVATFLLDHEGHVDLLTAKQRAVFDSFIAPLLTRPSTKE